MEHQQAGSLRYVTAWKAVLLRWRGAVRRSLLHRLDELVVVPNGRVENVFLQLRIERRIREIISHGGAVGELKLGGAQCEINRAEGDFDFGHEAAGGGGFGLERDLVNVVGVRFRKDPKARFQLGLAAREAGFEQREHVFPRAGRVAGERIFFSPFQPGINDEHLIRLPHGDGLRRAADFPAEAIGRGKPDMAFGDERLRET